MDGIDGHRTSWSSGAGAAITFGGAAQFKAALTITGGADSDAANSFLPVAFNFAIFTGGILGAALLTNFSGLVLAVVMIVAGLAALMPTICGRRTAFLPASRSCAKV